MNTLPERDPLSPQDSGAPPEVQSPDPDPAETRPPDYSPLLSSPTGFDTPFPAQEDSEARIQPPCTEPLLFQSWTQPEIHPPARIPHFGHLCILALLTIPALLGVSLLIRSALYFHLFGISTLQQAITDIHYMLGSMAALYLFTLAASALIFPLYWRKSLLAGLQWHGATALKLRRRLFAAAFVCFLLALANGLLMPGPENAPIDKIFRIPGAAWLLFAFGITFAPFFEEIVFRGFLLPALCTAWDWAIEQSTGKPALPLDENGHPQWSVFAMAVASVLTSIPFALMHAEQTGHALGPFLLLVCVSLVLCWARLSTRSLAASVLVHASYNFMLFALMLLGTGGFRHLDRM
jgi:membrane protease YdiL (CAAX protease family)